MTLADFFMITTYVMMWVSLALVFIFGWIIGNAETAYNCLLFEVLAVIFIFIGANKL